MGFNRRDLDDDDFDFDNNDDDFDFEDNATNDFDFGDDEPADIGLDDDAGGFGFEDEDMPDIDEDSGDGGGVSRTFIIIAALMILLFVGGLVAVLLISQQNSGPTEFDLTVTARVALNSTTEAQLAGTQTQAAFIDATGTAFALIPTETPTPSPSPSPSPTPTEDIPPTQEVAIDAAQFAQTQVAALTQVAAGIQTFQPAQVANLTEVASVSTPVQDPVEAAAATEVSILVSPLVPTQPGTFSTLLPPEQIIQLTQVATLIQGLDPTFVAQANQTQIAIAQVPTQAAPDANAVALTATSLALTLAPQTPIGQGGGEVPTQEVFPTSGVVPTALPDTGFFEDLAGGSANIGMIFLIGLGLIGLILVSRRVRLANK